MEKITTKCLCVKLKDAEKIRKCLIKKDLLNRDLELCKDDSFIYFPLNKIPRNLKNYEITKNDFFLKERIPKSYKDALDLPDSIRQQLPTSYNIIGDILLIKLKENLTKYEKNIGKALLEASKNIKTVYLVEPVSGEYRIRNIKLIAGKKSLITKHKEFGLTFDVDVKNTYFSPRLASERKRIVDMVNSDEIIVDMFTGVAPFSVMIAKYANPKIIYAIDKNKNAIKYAKINVKQNNVLDKIELINADAKDVVTLLKKKNVKADRIIMNLPFSAHLFFSYASKIMADSCVIHYYDILSDDAIDDRVDRLKNIAEKNEIELTKLNINKIKTYAPREFYIGIDITAKKINADVA